MFRLIIAIISTLLEEAAIVAVAVFGLPALGIRLPLAVLFVLMIGWAGVSVLIYRLGSRALKRDPVAGLPGMMGCDGQAVTSLSPEGTVRINGELWSARSVSGMIKAGEAVEVVGQENLKLQVRHCIEPTKETGRSGH